MLKRISQAKLNQILENLSLSDLGRTIRWLLSYPLMSDGSNELQRLASVIFTIKAGNRVTGYCDLKIHQIRFLVKILRNCGWKDGLEYWK